MAKPSKTKGQAESSKNSAGTPNVILFGETGCGKSHFISIAGKPKLKPTSAIGEPGDMNSKTESVAPITVEKSMPNHSQATCVQLIDTPGFNNKDIPDHKIAGVIIEWLLEEWVKPDTPIAGVLYLHDTNSQSKMPIYREDIIRTVPGARYITWSSIGKPAGEGYPFDNTNDTAWKIITKAMQEASSKDPTLTQGQLAKKLQGISGYEPNNLKKGAVSSAGVSSGVFSGAVSFLGSLRRKK